MPTDGHHVCVLGEFDLAEVLPAGASKLWVEAPAALGVSQALVGKPMLIVAPFALCIVRFEATGLPRLGQKVRTVTIR